MNDLPGKISARLLGARAHSGNVTDVSEANSLLHGQEKNAYGDTGYQGADKRADAKDDVAWHVAMRPGKRKE